MTIPQRITLLLAASRVPYDEEEIHFAITQQVSVTPVLIRDTLRLMATRGEVQETKDGWTLVDRPKAVKQQQGSLFG